MEELPKIEMSKYADKIMTIFDSKDVDIETINKLINIDLEKVPVGTSTFQIQNFILNKKEFTNDLFQYQQARTELVARIHGFIDGYFQLKEVHAKIMLAEGKIEELLLVKSRQFSLIQSLRHTLRYLLNKSNSKGNEKVTNARIELQRIEIEKNLFKISVIQNQSKEKLREASVFYETYINYKWIEDLPQEKIDSLEEEGWSIKAAYYRELYDRYQLTPTGRHRLPHEIGGLKAVQEKTSYVDVG